MVELVDWTVSHVDKESETCVLSCSLSVNTDKLYRMKELPIVHIEVKNKDGVKNHKHDVKIEIGTYLPFLPPPPPPNYPNVTSEASPTKRKLASTTKPNPSPVL